MPSGAGRDLDAGHDFERRVRGGSREAQRIHRIVIGDGERGEMLAQRVTNERLGRQCPVAERRVGVEVDATTALGYGRPCHQAIPSGLAQHADLEFDVGIIRLRGVHEFELRERFARPTGRLVSHAHFVTQPEPRVVIEVRVLERTLEFLDRVVEPALVQQAASDHLDARAVPAPDRGRDAERIHRLLEQAHLAIAHRQIVMPLGVAGKLGLDAALEFGDQRAQIERHRFATAHRHLDAARLRRRPTAARWRRGRARRRARRRPRPGTGAGCPSTWQRRAPTCAPARPRRCSRRSETSFEAS